MAENAEILKKKIYLDMNDKMIKKAESMDIDLRMVNPVDFVRFGGG